MTHFCNINNSLFNRNTISTDTTIMWCTTSHQNYNVYSRDSVRLLQVVGTQYTALNINKIKFYTFLNSTAGTTQISKGTIMI